MVAFDEGGQVAAGAVVEVELRLVRARERRLQVDNAGVRREGVAEEEEFRVSVSVAAQVRDYFADDDGAL